MSDPHESDPWLAAYATGAAQALVSGLDLLDGEDVTTRAVPDGFVLHVLADPPRAVGALRWSGSVGWSWSADPPWRGDPRWFPLPVPADADPLTLAEVLATLEESARLSQ